MEKEKIKRMVHCRRADFADKSKKSTLEQDVESAFAALSTVDGRRFGLNGGRRMAGLCCLENRNGGGLLIQIAVDTPGDAAPLVPKDGSSRAVAVGHQPAPKKAEYMDGDAMVYIKGNIVVICAKSVHNNIVEAYLRQLLIHAKIDGNWNAFSIEKLSNPDKLNMLQNEGVKHIRLSTSLYNSTLEMVKERRKKTPMDMVFGAIRTGLTRFENDKRLSVVRSDEDIVVSVVIDRKGRAKGDDAQKRVDTIAADILEQCDSGFSIVTNKGQTIRTDDVSLCRSLDMIKYGKTIDLNSAWAAMVSYYKELERAGFTKV